MNRLAMARLQTIAVLFACATLAACGTPSPGSSQQPPLAGASIGGPFTLVNKDGKTVHWSDFDGRYRIVYFGYTYCPDVCPTDVGRMIRGLKLFAQDHPGLAKQVQPIFISVDPDRDTPAVVGEFAAAFSPDLIGLTGSTAQVKAAEDAFKVYASKGEKQPGGGYLVNHSSITYLFGPKGEPIATLPTDQGPQAVAVELAKWVH